MPHTILEDNKILKMLKWFAFLFFAVMDEYKGSSLCQICQFLKKREKDD